MNIKPLLKPIMNNLPWLYDTFGLGTGGTISASYCYSVWLRHLIRAHEQGFELPRVVAELGPGDSLGVGLMALLTGADEYYALDIKEYANPERNLEILNNLIHLLSDKMSIPDDQEYPYVRPRLGSYTFPKDILSDEKLEKALAPERIRAVKHIIKDPKTTAKNGIKIKYCVPYDSKEVIQPNSVDLIVAQAVLEHVSDLKKTYQAVYSWLKPGGLFSQDIDFKSHNFTWAWNGHWAASDWRWKWMTGRREWAINRLPLSAHIKIMNEIGFNILSVERVERMDGIKRHKLLKNLEIIDDIDLQTSQAFVQARK